MFYVKTTLFCENEFVIERRTKVKSLKKGEKKMKTSPKLKMLLSVLLIATVTASVVLASTMPSTSVENAKSSEGVLTDVPLKTETASLETLAGAPGSGWKPDVKVAGLTGDEINPSMASYIDPSTGAVTLYVAVQRWLSDSMQWVIDIYRSDDQGASWYLWNTNTLAGRDAINPSIAVSPYNGTVFVAVESFSPLTRNDIIILRNEPTWWTAYWIDGDGDDDRNPQLISEYSWGSGNWLYVTYEMDWTYDDRDLMFARSTDWGRTWTITTLRGLYDTDEYVGNDVDDVYVESDIAYVQCNIYIAYIHSEDWVSARHIDIAYSTDFGSSWTHVYNIHSGVPTDPRNPSIAGSHVGPSQKPTTLWIAFENFTGTTATDILVSWSKDFGNHWSTPYAIAAAYEWEVRPQLSVDGMGSESLNVPGNFHLTYFRRPFGPDPVAAIYYTMIPVDEPDWRPDPQVYGYTVPWSTPQGQATGNTAVWYYGLTLTTFPRTVGGETLWVPGVAWTDRRNYPNHDVYFTTLDTMVSITFVPNSQTVVAGGSLSYYVTVNLISGATATATLYLTGRDISFCPQQIYSYSYSPPTVTPTATSTLTFYTSNYAWTGTHYVNASAVIGGYRRHATITFKVTTPPTLTLDLSPSTARRNITAVTFSGQLTPGKSTTVYILYRKPHETGSWRKLLTVTTATSGAYSVTYTFPPSKPLGQYDIVAFWSHNPTGSHATSPIKVLTLTK